MRFHDFTLLKGQISTRRVQDTDGLSAAALALCADMLAQLRRGAEFVPHPIPDAPAFGVSLGPPDWLLEVGQTVEAPGRFFCVAEPGKPAFQFNLVLPPGELTEVDERAVATALGLSLFAEGQDGVREAFGSEEVVETRIREITSARPVLATAMIATYEIDPSVYITASDFSTCFAAAMLLESRGGSGTGKETSQPELSEEPDGVPLPVMPTTDGINNDLIFAINHHFSTGQHVGEGMMGETNTHWTVVLSVQPEHPKDVKDFERLRLRLADIQVLYDWKLVVEFVLKAPNGFDIYQLHVPKRIARALAVALMAAPSSLGWGASKALMDKSWTGRQARILSVARQSGVWVASVKPATAEEVQEALAGKIDADVLEVALQPGETGKPTKFWRVPSLDYDGYDFYMDDPTFTADPVPLRRLAYNREIGLHVKDGR